MCGVEGSGALLRHVSDQLGQLGFAEAVLWVVPENSRARHLYESEGWRDDDVNRHDGRFGVIVPEMRYRRRLAEPPGPAPKASE